MKTIASLIVMLLFSVPSYSIQKFKYNELQIKDYDEMLDKVNDYVAEAKQQAIKHQEEGDDESGDQAAIDKLSEALAFILSRPDKDNMLAKLMPVVRKELINYNAFETSLSLTVTDAITTLQSAKLPVVYRSTSLFVLENIMAQVQPMIATQKDLRAIVEKIKAADIKVPNEVTNNRKLWSMFNTRSPSKTAEMLLQKHPPKAPEPEEPAPGEDGAEVEDSKKSSKTNE